MTDDTAGLTASVTANCHPYRGVAVAGSDFGEADRTATAVPGSDLAVGSQPPLWDEEPSANLPKVADWPTLSASEDKVEASMRSWLNEVQADRQARWEGRLRRGQALREELRLARAAGKAARHADRLRRIAAAQREE